MKAFIFGLFLVLGSAQAQSQRGIVVCNTYNQGDKIELRFSQRELGIVSISFDGTAHQIQKYTLTAEKKLTPTTSVVKGFNGRETVFFVISQKVRAFEVSILNSNDPGPFTTYSSAACK